MTVDGDMRSGVRKTSRFGLGRMLHVVHMTDDVMALTEFYERVFGGVTFMGSAAEPNYLEPEDRFATLVLVSDLCVEPMTPARPVNTSLPVGRFYSRYGEHLHSFGYRVDDIEGFAGHLIDRGVYIGRPGGGRLREPSAGLTYFYPHPRDVGGLLVELSRRGMPADPRDAADWTERAGEWARHPLGIRRLAYITVGVREIEPVLAVLRDTWLADQVEAGTDHDEGVRFVILQLGDSLVRLAQPVRADTELARHVETYGDFLYDFTFAVADLDAVEKHLRANGITDLRRGRDVVSVSPGSAFGAPIAFTTRGIPNDPLAGGRP